MKRSDTQPQTTIAGWMSLLLAWGAVLATHVFGQSLPQAPHRTPLLLISIDGFRHDYFDKADTPNLDQLRSGGLQAEGLIPVFPSNTFPNHYAIVTGLYPEHHGIIDNSFYDPVYEAVFDMYIAAEVTNDRWWHGEPVWVTVIKQGGRSATLFWPGSEARINGYRPTFWHPYDHWMPHPDRVQRILDWVDMPAGERPDFMTLYFHLVDDAGHDYGPDSPQLAEAVEKVDTTIGVLLRGLRDRAVLKKMHILIVSDHGMADISRERTVNLDDYVDTTKLRFLRTDPVAGIWVEQDRVPGLLKRLKRGTLAGGPSVWRLLI